MKDNPFAPPSTKADPNEGRDLVFSPEGAAVVASLATWMRGMSIILYVLVGGLVLGSCAFMAIGRTEGVIAVIAFLVIGGVVATAASWLRAAAAGFEHGVMSDDEMTLGSGFRSLRAYLILMGIFSVLSLANTIYEVIG